MTQTNLNHHWLRKWLRGEPHVVIGGSANPYLLRWFVIPRNKRFNIYLHKFMRSDDDRALHDHPWPWWSFVLRGSYTEHLPGGVTNRRTALSLAHRAATDAHRVELDRTQLGYWVGEKPVWTIFMTGSKKREWGFHCPRGWTHWERFDSNGGCGEQ